MIQAIIDSGSTKSDWRIISDTQVISFQTEGFNPYFTGEEKMKELIIQNVSPHIALHSIGKLFFYGAGCSAAAKKKQVFSVMRECFPNAQVQVETDLLGAARALLQNRRGLVAILGTGANSGYYDGEKIIESVDSAGYLLGDEGSGAHLGKLILRTRLRNGFTKELEEKFIEFCPLSRDEVFTKLYNHSFPNRFLSHLSRFAYENINDPVIRRLVKNSFSDFIINNLMGYKEYKKYAVHFTGSIAFFFRELLAETCREMDVKVEAVIQSPIEQLLIYHRLRDIGWNNEDI